MPLRYRIEPLLRPLIQLSFRLRRGMTLGVRAVVLNAEGQVLLVEHSYQPGWRLPGGGVERGESAGEALARELEEEAGVRTTGPPALLSVHSQEARFKGDHVLVYRVEAWTPCPASDGVEIARRAWFDPADLPAETTDGTRRRLAEAIGAALPDPLW